MAQELWFSAELCYASDFEKHTYLFCEDTLNIEANTILQRSTEIVFNEIDGEVVMMGPNFESYFGMEACAARIWTLLEQEFSFTSLCERLAEEFEVDPEQCAGETRAFLVELCEQKLVAARPQTPSKGDA